MGQFSPENHDGKRSDFGMASSRVSGRARSTGKAPAIAFGCQKEYLAIGSVLKNGSDQRSCAAEPTEAAALSWVQWRPPRRISVRLCLQIKVQRTANQAVDSYSFGVLGLFVFLHGLGFKFCASTGGVCFFLLCSNLFHTLLLVQINCLLHQTAPTTFSSATLTQPSVP